MKITPITQDQLKSILKAAIYSFAAGFVGALTLQATDIIAAVQSGHGALVTLLVSVLVGAVTAGINSVAFTVEKLLTKD